MCFGSKIILFTLLFKQYTRRNVSKAKFEGEMAQLKDRHYTICHDVTHTLLVRLSSLIVRSSGWQPFPSLLTAFILLGTLGLIQIVVTVERITLRYNKVYGY